MTTAAVLQTTESKPLGIALYLRGLAYQKEGNSFAAMVDWKAAVVYHPQFVPAHHRLAEMCSTVGETAESVAHYRQVFTLAPSLRETCRRPYAEALNRWGYSLYMADKNDEAIAAFQEALEIEPTVIDKETHSRAHNSRGVDYSRAGQREKAIAEYCEAINLWSGNAQAWSNRALQHQHFQRHQEAISDFSEAIRLEPTDYQRYCWRAQSYHATKAHEQAVADIATVERSNVTDAIVLQKLGYAYHVLGQNDAALATYQKGAGLHPTDAQFLSQIAHIHFENGHYCQSLTALDTGIQLAPKHRDLHWWQASTMERLECYVDALAAIKRAFKIGPINAGMHFRRANICFGLHRYAQAYRSYTHALELDPQNAERWYLRATTAARLGRTVQAMADITNALRLDATDARYHWCKSTIEWQQERTVEALQSINRANECCPNHFRYYAERSWYQYASGKMAEAQAGITATLQIDANDSRASYKHQLEYYFESPPNDVIADIDRSLAANQSCVNYVLLHARLLLAQYRPRESLDVIRFGMKQSPQQRHQFLGFRAQIYYALKQYAKAHADYDKAVQESPNNINLLKFAAFFWGTCSNTNIRDSRRAIRLAKRAIRLNKEDDYLLISTLAIIYANAGDFPNAIRQQQQAIVVMGEHRDERFHHYLNMYKAGKPLLVD